jgi:predicted XRE-type DNA-binding protein
MKKKQIEGAVFSKTPPPGWPTEAQFAEVKSIMVENAVREAEPKLGKSVTEVDKIKHELCKEFYRCFEHSEMMQRDFAKKLKISESRVSEILSYRYESYTIDKLFSLILLLKPQAMLELEFKS